MVCDQFKNVLPDTSPYKHFSSHTLICFYWRFTVITIATSRITAWKLSQKMERLCSHKFRLCLRWRFHLTVIYLFAQFQQSVKAMEFVMNEWELSIPKMCKNFRQFAINSSCCSNHISMPWSTVTPWRKYYFPLLKLLYYKFGTELPIKSEFFRNRHWELTLKWHLN